MLCRGLKKKKCLQRTGHLFYSKLQNEMFLKGKNISTLLSIIFSSSKKNDNRRPSIYFIIWI